MKDEKLGWGSKTPNFDPPRSVNREPLIHWQKFRPPGNEAGRPPFHTMEREQTTVRYNLRSSPWKVKTLGCVRQSQKVPEFSAVEVVRRDGGLVFQQVVGTMFRGDRSFKSVAGPTRGR